MWNLIAGSYGIFIIGTTLSIIMSGRWFSSGEIGIINTLSGMSVNYVAGWPVPSGMADYINALITMIAWDYPFLDNPWCFVLKLILLYPVSIGVIVGLLMLLATVVSGILSAVRSLLPG